MDKALGRLDAVENIPYRGRCYLCHSRHKGGEDDGENVHGDSHNARNHKMDPSHNFDIPFEKLLSVNVLGKKYILIYHMHASKNRE